MDSQRRHDLETNDLAKKIIQAPDYFKLYGGRIALAVVVIFAVAMLVNFRIRSSRENLAAAQQGLTMAREAITRLAANDMLGMGQPDDMAARQRQELISGAQQAIDTVTERSDDPKLLAQAAALRGDLYWTVANLTELEGAATRPTLAVEPKAEDALTQAEAAYRRVLETYADQAMPVITARFGLAAVAENRGQWDEARKQYQAIEGNANVGESFKTIATARMRTLGQFEKGVYLAQPVASTQPATAATTTAAPTTAPAGTQPVR